MHSGDEYLKSEVSIKAEECRMSVCAGHPLIQHGWSESTLTVDFRASRPSAKISSSKLNVCFFFRRKTIVIYGNGDKNEILWWLGPHRRASESCFEAYMFALPNVEIIFSFSNYFRHFPTEWESSKSDHSKSLTVCCPCQLMTFSYLGVLRSSRINCHSWTCRLPGADSDFIRAHSGTFEEGELSKYKQFRSRQT